ncbi:MAG: hypothetical protein K2K26_03150, partial [Muribaculaceae bacterium]|nr:hypothetical protein [Muribaculaceae bacterium]
VNDTFTVVGAWACNPYIREFCDFIRAVKPNLNDDVIIIGDLNSNVIFDKNHKRSVKTHSIIVDELHQIGIEDIYHYITGDAQGEERVPTFYMYRHLDKPFHIDHCFSNPKNIQNITIHPSEQWISLSDHLPIEIETHNNTLLLQE